MILEVAPVADTQKGRDYPAQDAAAALGAPTANTIDAALGANFDTWTQHVQQHVQLPDEDGDGEVEAADIVVPILQYGDGVNDYIATDIDAGQVVVRDGNDATGRAWKFPLRSFYRFLAKSQGKKLAGDDDEAAKGDTMYEAAIKQQQRTNRLAAAEREASEQATTGGRSTTATSNRAAANATVASQNTKSGTGK
jgi:hypothetical protein